MLGNFPPKNPTEQKLLRKLSHNLKVSLKFHVPENRNHPFKQWLVLNSSLLRSRYVYRQATVAWIVAAENPAIQVWCEDRIKHLKHFRLSRQVPEKKKKIYRNS